MVGTDLGGDHGARMRWKSTFFYSFLAQVLGILGFSFCTPFLPFFVGELGVEDAGAQAFWAGVALSSAGFTFAVFAPIWGVVADRYGRKIMVCRAMFGGGLALLLMSFSRTVPQLVLFRVFQGAFSGTLAASIALVASVVPQHRSGLTLGMMQAAVFIGNAVGPFFGGMAADAFGYRVSFRIGALLTVLGGVLVYLDPIRKAFRMGVFSVRCSVFRRGSCLESVLWRHSRGQRSLIGPSLTVR